MLRPQPRKAIRRRFCGQRPLPCQRLLRQHLYHIRILPCYIVRLRPIGFDIVQFCTIEFLVDQHLSFAVPNAQMGPQIGRPVTFTPFSVNGLSSFESETLECCKDAVAVQFDIRRHGLSRQFKEHGKEIHGRKN